MLSTLSDLPRKKLKLKKENGHLDIFLLGTTGLSSTVHVRDAALKTVFVKPSFCSSYSEALKCAHLSFLV